MRRILPILALFVSVGGLSVQPARAQGSSAAPLLLEPLDWSGNGAWRRRAARVRTERTLLLRQGNIAALNAVGPNAARRTPFQNLVFGGLPQSAVIGAYRVPVIAINYKDIVVAGTTYPVASFQCLLFSQSPQTCGTPLPRPYSVSTYYEEASQHRITLDGVVLPPARMDSIAAFYTDGCKGFTISGQTSCPPRPQNRMALMLVAALDSINNRPGGDTIWGQFDNDGDDGIPNSGDDDGTVDFVTFLQPEVGGECIRNDPPPTGIWSHRFVISGWAIQTALGGFTTRTPRRNSSGQPIPGQFIKVNDYTIQSQLGGITSCDGGAIMGVGTIAHETGHAFGLPDLYDTSGGTQGIGGWGIMGSGNYARPYSPSSFDPWSLLTLGWATVDTLGTSRLVTTGPRLLTDTIFYARTTDPEEYLLVDNRQAVRSDTAQMNNDLPGGCPITGMSFCAKSPGLTLWLINQLRVQGGLPGNAVNTGSLHGVALLQADGLNHLRQLGSTNRGDRGDSYPGTTNNSKLSLLTTPQARGSAGNPLGFIIDQITQLPNSVMSFRFTRRAPSLIQAFDGALIQVNGEPWTRYEEVIPGGDQLQLSAEENQVLAGGKTRTRFVAWSNGGPRTQTLVSDPVKPDTISASFTTEHRLLVFTNGVGNVASSAAGNLAQGVFLNRGAPVTLTASVPTGVVFAGWRGDTIASDPTLQLTMRKGYDLEARFLQIVSVTVQDAVNDILGSATLAVEQRAFLDELGNRNGLFDVGDLLAFYRRQGLAVPPAVVEAALRRQRP